MQIERAHAEADEAESIEPIEHDVQALNNLMDALEIRHPAAQKRAIAAFSRIGCRSNRVL